MFNWTCVYFFVGVGFAQEAILSKHYHMSSDLEHINSLRIFRGAFLVFSHLRRRYLLVSFCLFSPVGGRPSR